MRLTATLILLAGLQLTAAVKPPGYPRGRPVGPHFPPHPHSPPHLRYPPPPHGGFSPRLYGPAVFRPPQGYPQPPHGYPRLPHGYPRLPHVSPHPTAAPTTTAPSAPTDSQPVAPPVTTAAPSTPPPPKAASAEEDPASSVYFPTSGRVTETVTGDAQSVEAVAEAPPTTESQTAKEAEPETSSAPALQSSPRPAHPPAPHSIARPLYHPRPYPHRAPLPGRYHSPPPRYHGHPGPYHPRVHSKPKTYFASGKRAVAPPATTPAPVTTTTLEKELPSQPVSQAVPTATLESQAVPSQHPTSHAPTYATQVSSTLPPSTAATYSEQPTTTRPLVYAVQVDSKPTLPRSEPSYAPQPTTRQAPPPSVSYDALQVVPSQPVPPSVVPSKSPSRRPVYPQRHDSSDDSDSNIPGRANVDYPTLSEVPETSFTCDDKIPGYYADEEASCQVWHYCGSGVSRQSFLCPVGTVYSQRTRVCDWWFNVNCAASESQYGVNADLYQPAPAPAAYGQRRSARAETGALAPQPYSQGPHQYHALPQTGVQGY